MNELKWIVWMFPLLFIIHDMEEIITAKNWCAKGFKKHIPLPFTPFGNTTDTAGFSVAVYEELILWCLAAFVGNIFGFYGLWYGLLIMNIAHLVLLHMILLPISYRHYVPGEITAWITVIPCCYVLKLAQNILQYSIIEITLWVGFGFLFGFINLKILHKNIEKLGKLIKF
ncbi:HXXEE domain-containing protein [Anaerosacchariphilus polymeriproducens]|uniref:HXXEE domain-containing protein n=1 Tax=Anaerosacchariphilus polymeriproducens TaxID=1812858 RepID=A0A371AVF2_9FIRM|nr:HXXEE domain-containing protein [Anaerosacchariphilus polymeriproducens]RDU23519.1 HXXEE domain-containing protein [Anaerosacchariphilus polymeriproducens]